MSALPLRLWTPVPSPRRRARQAPPPRAPVSVVALFGPSKEEQRLSLALSEANARVTGAAYKTLSSRYCLIYILFLAEAIRRLAAVSLELEATQQA